MIEQPATVKDTNNAEFITGKIIPIHVNGSQSLRQECVDVDLNDKDIKVLIANMLQTMRGADGIGLAAPQIGVNKNLFVIEITDFEDDENMQNNNPELKSMVFINPKIEEVSQETCPFKEGCLSVPGINENVVRPKTIKISFFDSNLKPQNLTLSGIWARAFQHEFDHLQGKLFVDSIAQIRKQMISTKLQAMTKGKYKAHYKTTKK